MENKEFSKNDANQFKRERL